MKHQLFADYQERLEDLQHRLHREVQDLSSEAIDWSPGPQMNSVAVLLAHITGLLQEGIDIALNNLLAGCVSRSFKRAACWVPRCCVA